MKEVHKSMNPSQVASTDEQNLQAKCENQELAVTREASIIDKPKDRMKKTTNTEYWTLKFDGSKSKQGAGAGFELISPKGKSFFAAHRLQFHCTNTVAEYEALIHGLLMALKKKVKVLQVFGDS